MHRLSRPLWLLLAYACTGLALAGVALPLLPATPFALLAVYAAARGSERLHARLVAHRALGPVLEAWAVHRAVPRGAKRLGASTIALSGGLLFVLSPSALLAAAACAPMGAVALWLWLRPDPPAA